MRINKNDSFQSEQRTRSVFPRRLCRLLRGLHWKKLRGWLFREAGFGWDLEGDGEGWGGRAGWRERGVRLVSYPLMIKTLSQSCRQPDLAVFFFFLFPFFLWGGGEGGRGCLLVPGCR
jgi:hypothetical protein